MGNLGGHDMPSLLDAFAAAGRHDRPTLFICYTVKGFGLPLAGHKDNHAGLMTPAQMEGFRASAGVRPGLEWEKWEGRRSPPPISSASSTRRRSSRRDGGGSPRRPCLCRRRSPIRSPRASVS